MNLNKFIVEETTSIIDVTTLMNENARQIIFVCRNDQLVAALADGDIRRFLVNDGDLSEPVSKIANYNVKSLQSTHQAQALDFMHNNSIRAVPIVNSTGQIIAIKFLDFEDVYKTVHLDVPVVIMAGGKGTRLAPYTNILPKSLIPIGEKTITEHIMERFSLYGCDIFHIILNYRKELVKAYFSDVPNEYSIRFHEEQEFLGTGGGLNLLDGIIESSFFMTNCDILIDADYEDLLLVHKQTNALITMVCAERKIVVPYGIIELEDSGKPVSLSEKPEYSALVNTGLYVIEPEFLKHIPEGKVAITDVIQKLMDLGCVGVYTISEEAWLDMGEFEQMDKMKAHLGTFDARLG